MLTDLQKKKLPNLFAVHDLDRDGVLRRGDFEQYATRVASVRGWEPGSPQHEELTTRFMTFWDGFESFADASGDLRITLEEWLLYWDQILSTPGMYDQVAKPIGDFIFNLFDRDGDGRVTQEEYAFIYQFGGLDPAQAAAAFARLDLDGDGFLSVSEIMTLLGQFFRSNDPRDPGNWLFGPFEEKPLVSATAR
jgi:Ca2+-binding EF-hand superfamily protein